MNDAPQGMPGAPDGADAGAVDAVDAAFRFTVEHQAVRGGDTNFPGVGWPGRDGRVTRVA